MSMTMCCAVLSLTHAVVNGPSFVNAPSAESIRCAIVVQFGELGLSRSTWLPTAWLIGHSFPHR